MGVDNLHVTHCMVYDIEPNFDGQEFRMFIRFQPKSHREMPQME